MKYRRLSAEELKPLEKEFVDFLVVNGVVADDWVTLKEKSPGKADGIIDAFSDVVFEGILRKTQFVEHRSKKEILTFSCMADKIYLAGLRYEGNVDGGVDFSDNDYIQSVLDNPPSGLKIFTQEKAYAKDREVEIFEMLQNGAVISEGRLWKAISIAKVANESGN